MRKNIVHFSLGALLGLGGAALLFLDSQGLLPEGSLTKVVMRLVIVPLAAFSMAIHSAHLTLEFMPLGLAYASLFILLLAYYGVIGVVVGLSSRRTAILIVGVVFLLHVIYLNVPGWI